MPRRVARPWVLLPVRFSKRIGRRTSTSTSIAKGRVLRCHVGATEQRGNHLQVRNHHVRVVTGEATHGPQCLVHRDLVHRGLLCRDRCHVEAGLFGLSNATDQPPGTVGTTARGLPKPNELTALFRPEQLTVPILEERKVDLLPIVKDTVAGDGRRADVTVTGDVLTLDATDHSPQL